MNISAWAIRNPVPSLLLFVLLTVFGVLGMRRLGIQNFPDMDLPTIQIAASLEGAAPAQLETEVARKIEDKLASLTRLDHITTTITDGSVAINVTFEIDKDTEEALNEVRNAVDWAKGDLPASMTSPTVSKMTSAGGSILTCTVEAANLGEEELSWFVDNNVSKALMSVKGVAAVSRVGGVDREVHVDLDPGLMAGMGVALSDVSTQLKAVQQDVSGGRGEVGRTIQSLRTLGAVHTADEVAALTIPLSDGRRVRLDQIAKVSDTHAERSTLAYLDGKQVIGFQVTRSKGFSDVSVADDVRAALARFKALHPEVRIREISNSVDPIQENYHGSMHLLLEGAILAVVVVWLFLKDWRATVISATALPLSIVPTFMVMKLCGFSLNVISLLALALVVGILVDDAIVEVENIARHLRQGKSPYQAAMEAADEIGLAVIATTLTLVAVFLPTAFMGGIPGRVFRQFGITAAAAVLASLLVARLLTPMMAAYFMKESSHQESESRLMARYLGWLKSCLGNRRRTAIAALLFLAGSVALIPLISTGFMPASDDGQTQVSVELPPGSTLEETARTALRSGTLIRKIPDIAQVFASVGTASTGGGMGASATASVNSATLSVQMKPRDQRRKQVVIEQEIREALREIPGARISVGRGNNGEKLEVTLASDDPNLLKSTAAALEREMRTLKGVGNVASGDALQRPEIQIYPDYARASQLGVTVEALGEAVRLATYGDYGARLNKLNLPQRQIPVRVRLNPETRNDLNRIGMIRVAGSKGQAALSSLAEIRMGGGASQIDRLDRYRNVTVSVELNGRPLGEVMREVRALPSMRNLPQGVSLVEQGELQRMGELFGSFGTAMAIGILCIYVVLVLLFHDFLQPVTILAALPLSLGGALLALIVTRNNFSMPAVIGLLMLMGVVTKNSILLVEYAVMARREHGMGRLDALIDACRKRSRPILMTTIAMGAGMFPIALGLGADPSFRQPMAIIVIGGLMTSTLLSLFVIPVLFTYVDDLLQVFRRRLPKRDHPEIEVDVDRGVPSPSVARQGASSPHGVRME
ncbi:efflux RND transporter permease subunit [Geomesophilobacter sediminis]|uniref:Efflux RND transporter permease subunit n=1 Tax=Geomesophilobacter sediminis TaxID=2798584 RepID=A0A8J7M0J1_9BACT|nr:efflux RND transporter permease subunit [Geomesophilobacter sediminis]MBJ6725457.1 efflux RND transporter permease subunit [Geomesophilobacter sediminis]